MKAKIQLLVCFIVLCLGSLNQELTLTKRRSSAPNVLNIAPLKFRNVFTNPEDKMELKLSSLEQSAQPDLIKENLDKKLNNGIISSFKKIDFKIVDYFDPRLAVNTPDEFKNLGVHKDNFVQVVETRRKSEPNLILPRRKLSYVLLPCSLCDFAGNDIKDLIEHLKTHLQETKS